MPHLDLSDDEADALAGNGNTRDRQCGLALVLGETSITRDARANRKQEAGGLPLVLRDGRCGEAMRDTTGRRQLDGFL